MSSRPIAVFDSGLGGLSVVRHLRRLMPAERICYFGDTARVPYGTKSRLTVARFGIENARFLMRFEPKLIAVACNTASALALDEIREAVPVPVVGVVEPGARAAAQHVKSSRTDPAPMLPTAGTPMLPGPAPMLPGGTPMLPGVGDIAILGTEGTIRSGAYETALRRLAPGVAVHSLACPLFVPLVEEGRSCDDPVVGLVVDGYLRPLKDRNIGAVVLACTHYPLLKPAIATRLDGAVRVIDSGREAARAVRDVLAECGNLCRGKAPASIQYYVSDNPRRFRSIGSRFLNEGIDRVELVPPQRYVRCGARTLRPARVATASD